MAYLNDMTDEERRQLEESGGGVPAAVSPGGGATPSPVAPSSGFQNLASYFNANRDTAQTQGETQAKDLEKRAVGDIFGNDPGAAMDTIGRLDAATTPGGLASIDQGDRSAGESRLDAYLNTRGTEPGRFQGLKDRFGGALRNVEGPMSFPDVRAPFVVPEGYTEAIVKELGGQPPLVATSLAQAKRAEMEDAQRYGRETAPYRDYLKRQAANRAPFRELHDYYYPSQGGGQ